VVAVDVTVHKTLATAQGISGVPTMKFFNGATYLADYKGARNQAEMAEWILDKMQAIKLEYDTKLWSRYTQSSYTLPARFLYVYTEGETPDTSKLFQAIRKKGIYAEAQIPKEKVDDFLKSYNLNALPALTTTASGALKIVKNNEIDKALEEIQSGTGDGEQQNGKRFGDDNGSTDSHGAFTFLFFLCGIIALAVFAWNKLSFPQRSRENSKSV
jgi:hypothetical protein